jgi:hypothetical protein
VSRRFIADDGVFHGIIGKIEDGCLTLRPKAR